MIIIIFLVKKSGIRIHEDSTGAIYTIGTILNLIL